ncbi:LysE family translocator [Shewanella surugensis]|uniref:LysE family translocator n=1 Tax=Shewanella surugensis TaxID=212020 RepID=A0ABT0L8L8_9GAMM|nr:LysE family translocator [Shewanella surugensis]MCL1124042.1 LysE family translocator [Shewanella surugensis]
MNFDTWLLFSFAVLMIAISPGTMAVLSMNHGIHYGKKRSLITGFGSVSAAMLLMLASAAGLGAILSNAEYGFVILKWCGGAYLLFLGIKLLFSKNDGKGLHLEQKTTQGTPKGIFKQAFTVGISNPKDLLFFSALFPQFIDMSLPQLPQLLILALTWAIIDFSFVMIYASLANVLAPKLTESQKLHWFDRFSGAIFITLAGLLITRNNN